MNELHLVGYTADLKYVIFSDAEGGERFRASLDADLLATFREITDLLGPADERRLPTSSSSSSKARRADLATAAAAGAGDGPEPGEDPLVGLAVLRGLPAAAATGTEAQPDGDDATGADERPRNSLLSPRQIQAQLRAGVSAKVVARNAGTTEAWVRRWLPPIEAERERVLRAVQSQRMTKARLGPSAGLLGDSVAANLRVKGLDPDGEDVVWAVTRREGETTWQVALRYRSRGRPQRALWRFDPDRRELDPRNALAVDLAWTRRGRKTEFEDAPPAAPIGASKKAAASKRTAKRPATTKAATPRASAARASAARASAARASAARASAARASAAKASAAKASTAKASTAKASTAKASTAKASTAKASTAKRPRPTKAVPLTTEAAKRSTPSRAVSKRTPRRPT